MNMNTQPSVPAGRASEPTGGVTTLRTRSTAFTRLAAAWWALAVGLLILIILLIFVAQNTVPVTAHFLGLHWNLPVGIGYSLAGVAGAGTTVLIGGARMVQLRRAARKTLPPPL